MVVLFIYFCRKWGKISENLIKGCACDKQIDGARGISARATVNVFFNNKRLEKSAQVRKQKVAAFKKRQRTKKAKEE